MMKRKRIAWLLCICMILGLSVQPGTAEKAPFIDVVDHWSEDAVTWGADAGLICGVGGGCFAPDMVVTRSQLAQLIYRFADPLFLGTHTADSDANYPDMAQDAWYTAALSWALDTGLMPECSGNAMPAEPVSRQDAAGAFFALASLCGVSPTETGARTAFIDGDTVSADAVDAVEWALGAGLLVGVSEEELQPLGTLDRAQAATIFKRFSAYLDGKLVPQTISVPADQAHVRIGGRYYTHDGCTVLSTSASYIAFAVEGTDCTVYFEADDTAVAGDLDRCARMRVLVDGVETAEFMMNRAQYSVTAFHGLRYGRHTVKIEKLSEATCSVIGISAIEAHAVSITPTAGKERFIEFFGDSFTAGYGIQGSRFDNFQTKQENAALTYAYKTAYAFDADYSLVAYSAYGVCSGSTSWLGPINFDGKISGVLGLVGKANRNFHGTNSRSYAWDYASDAQPDAVVINLGENDVSYCGDDPERMAAFQTAYEELLTYIRTNRSDADIFCIVGMESDNTYDAMAAAIAAFCARTGDERVHALRLTQVVNSNYPVGADGHPKEKANTVTARELISVISETLGWQTVHDI